jgi:hypothetical protein
LENISEFFQEAFQANKMIILFVIAVLWFGPPKKAARKWEGAIAMVNREDFATTSKIKILFFSDDATFLWQSVIYFDQVTHKSVFPLFRLFLGVYIYIASKLHVVPVFAFFSGFVTTSTPINVNLPPKHQTLSWILSFSCTIYANHIR